MRHLVQDQQLETIFMLNELSYRTLDFDWSSPIYRNIYHGGANWQQWCMTNICTDKLTENESKVVTSLLNKLIIVQHVIHVSMSVNYFNHRHG